MIKLKGSRPEYLDQQLDVATAKAQLEANLASPGQDRRFRSSKFSDAAFVVSCHGNCLWIDPYLEEFSLGHPAARMGARFKCSPKIRPYWDLWADGKIVASERDGSREAWERFRLKVSDVLGFDLPANMYPGDQPDPSPQMGN